MRASSDSETAARGSPAPADRGRQNSTANSRTAAHKRFISSSSGMVPATRAAVLGDRRAKGSAALEDSRTVRPASTVSFPVERPLKGKSVSGNAGNRDSINTNAFEKGGMDSALAGLGREKRSLQKGPPSPMPPCRFKRNGPYSFSGSASLRNHSGLWCLMCSSGTYPVNMDRSAGASPGAKAAM